MDEKGMMDQNIEEAMKKKEKAEEHESFLRRKEELVKLVEQLAGDTSLHGFKQIHDNKGEFLNIL